MYTKKELIRTDRNGTKYFRSQEQCAACRGSGTIRENTRGNRKICKKCGGTGYIELESKEYTPEYAAVLEQRRAIRAIEKEEEQRQKKAEWVKEEKEKLLRKTGFNEEGFIWLFCGNTYENRDKIKELGGKYSPVLGWHIDHEIEGWKMQKVAAEEVLTITECSVGFDINKCVEIKKEIKGTQDNISYIGNPGDKIVVNAKFVKSIPLRNRRIPSFIPADKYLHIFEDTEDRKYVWITGCEAFTDKGSLSEGDSIVLSGTIKENCVHNGEPETRLIRCKLTKNVSAD